tara:strand:- start:366 stop:548 length:183 start_codon:yes stop_codon:yes gene_type:complete
LKNIIGQPTLFNPHLFGRRMSHTDNTNNMHTDHTNTPSQQAPDGGQTAGNDALAQQNNPA